MNHAEHDETIGSMLASIAAALREVSEKLDVVAARVQQEVPPFPSDDDVPDQTRIRRLESWAFHASQDISRLSSRLDALDGGDPEPTPGPAGRTRSRREVREAAEAAERAAEVAATPATPHPFRNIDGARPPLERRNSPLRSATDHLGDPTWPITVTPVPRATLDPAGQVENRSAVAIVERESDSAPQPSTGLGGGARSAGHRAGDPEETAGPVERQDSDRRATGDDQAASTPRGVAAGVGTTIERPRDADQIAVPGRGTARSTLSDDTVVEAVERLAPQRLPDTGTARGTLSDDTVIEAVGGQAPQRLPDDGVTRGTESNGAGSVAPGRAVSFSALNRTLDTGTATEGSSTSDDRPVIRDTDTGATVIGGVTEANTDGFSRFSVESTEVAAPASSPADRGIERARPVGRPAESIPARSAGQPAPPERLSAGGAERPSVDGTRSVPEDHRDQAAAASEVTGDNPQHRRLAGLTAGDHTDPAHNGSPVDGFDHPDAPSTPGGLHWTFGDDPTTPEPPRNGHARNGFTTDAPRRLDSLFDDFMPRDRFTAASTDTPPPAASTPPHSTSATNSAAPTPSSTPDSTAPFPAVPTDTAAPAAATPPHSMPATNSAAPTTSSAPNSTAPFSAVPTGAHQSVAPVETTATSRTETTVPRLSAPATAPTDAPFQSSTDESATPGASAPSTTAPFATAPTDSGAPHTTSPGASAPSSPAPLSSGPAAGSGPRLSSPFDTATATTVPEPNASSAAGPLDRLPALSSTTHFSDHGAPRMSGPTGSQAAHAADLNDVTASGVAGPESGAAGPDAATTPGALIHGSPTPFSAVSYETSAQSAPGDAASVPGFPLHGPSATEEQPKDPFHSPSSTDEPSGANARSGMTAPSAAYGDTAGAFDPARPTPVDSTVPARLAPPKNRAPSTGYSPPTGFTGSADPGFSPAPETPAISATTGAAANPAETTADRFDSRTPPDSYAPLGDPAESTTAAEYDPPTIGLPRDREAPGPTDPAPPTATDAAGITVTGTFRAFDIERAHVDKLQAMLDELKRSSGLPPGRRDVFGPPTPEVG
ncbi:hypothetical protein ACFXK0_15870 [Nocardia sp. NPDC059177]|uniref:hypothetical protein n=1 Tax=Nocardia sp. NPDC059177 TaxID=3346759 RepID=UPI0036762985